MLEISIIMSVYNAGFFLKESIDSILNQTHENFELIIINDGSTDKSSEIIKSYADPRIVIINQKNQGLSKALNNGIRIAKGKFITRMDADDISKHNRIEKQLQFLNNNPECVVVGSNTDIIDVNGNYLYTSSLPTSWVDIKKKLPEAFLFHSATMFRKDTFEKVGGYNEEIFHHFEDKILWNKMSKHGELRNLPDILIKYRLVPNSISNKKSEDILLLREIANKIIKNEAVTKEDLENINQVTSISKNEKYSNYYLRLGNIHLHNKNLNLALKNLLISLRYLPLNFATWKNLGLCLLPPIIYSKIRKIRNV